MAAGLKKTPLHDEHLALGARMVPFAGWEMPVQYAGIMEEHRAVRSGVGVFDICHMSEFRVFGFEAFDFLQHLLTNDLSRIAELGAAQYTLACDDDGGIVDDLIVYHTGELEYLVVGNAANRDTDLDWLKSHAPARLEFVDESDRTGLIAVQGPSAAATISELAGGSATLPDRFHIAEARLGDVPVLLARTGYTGEDGFEIVCAAESAVAVWRLLMSVPEVVPCGLGARDTLRLEMGYPLYGSDIDRGVDPLSAGLGWVVASSKGDFVGSEAIATIAERGPERRLVGLAVDGGVPRPGFALLREGDEVGKVASGSFSPTLGTGIATAYLPVALALPGTELGVSIRGRTAHAVVRALPFVSKTSLPHRG